ncbi:MAG: DMT family transporter [Castellaniella sp.]
MPLKDLRDLFLLASIWGSSFLFLRLAVHDFGPVPLIETRIGIGAAFLVAVAVATRRLPIILRHWRVITVGGIISVLLPFLLWGYAAQHLTAGFMAIVNALAPLFGAIVARLWLGEHLTRMRMAGLAIGFGGIVILVWDSLSMPVPGQLWSIAASIGAPLCYGIAASFMTRYFKGLDPIACAAGSIASSALLLLPLTLVTWPATPVSGISWLSALLLGLACTGIAYIIFYRLIENVGPSKSITVTFLVPPFGVFWGAVVLDEAVTWPVIMGAGTVLLGTLLATGVLHADSLRRTDTR